MPTPMSSPSNSQRGMTLVELMVAMTIGVFIVGAVSAVYINTRGSFDYSTEVARIQETGRFALDTISRDIRMAGYNGCGKSVPTFNVLNNSASNPLLNFATPIRGYEGGYLGTLQAPLNALGNISGTDIIVLIGGSPDGDLVVSGHNPNSAQIDTSAHSVQAGEILLVTDCAKASIFQMTGPSNINNNATNVVHNSGTGTPGNCTKFLGASCPGSSSYTYKPGATMMRLSSNAYYIAPSVAVAGMNSLWSLRLQGSNGTPVAQELLVGVDNMQIAYGVDNAGADGSVDSYLTANNVTNWSQVVSVRVSLLVRSTRVKTTSDAQPYTYMSSPGSLTESQTTPSDRILRQVFTETVVARNRTK